MFCFSLGLWLAIVLLEHCTLDLSLITRGITVGFKLVCKQLCSLDLYIKYDGSDIKTWNYSTDSMPFILTFTSVR